MWSRATKPLAGKRILITRARHQAGTLAAALEAKGAEVIAIPAIEIVPPDSYGPLDDALRQAADYQWLILTSVNGVEALWQRMQALGLRAEALRGVELAAIGPATARALESHGLHVSVVPREYVAEAVVDALRDQVRGRRVLLVRAKVARDVIPTELTKAGAQVDVVEAYRTVVPAESREAVRAIFSASALAPDAITFTSSSTVMNFFNLMKEAGLCREPGAALPPSVTVVSIGPVTSRTLRAHGVEPTVEAGEYTIPGVVAALCGWAAVDAGFNV